MFLLFSARPALNTLVPLDTVANRLLHAWRELHHSPNVLNVEAETQRPVDIETSIQCLAQPRVTAPALAAAPALANTTIERQGKTERDTGIVPNTHLDLVSKI